MTESVLGVEVVVSLANVQASDSVTLDDSLFEVPEDIQESLDLTWQSSTLKVWALQETRLLTLLLFHLLLSHHDDDVKG